VIDTVDNFDGLERLIILAVGLDACSTSESMVGDRMRLYRAIMRGQMLIAVVNEMISGGWLEFLGQVKLKEEVTSDPNVELTRQKFEAAEAAKHDADEAHKRAVEASGAVETTASAAAAAVIEQTVWDTSANSNTPILPDLAFDPFKR